MIPYLYPPRQGEEDRGKVSLPVLHPPLARGPSPTAQAALARSHAAHARPPLPGYAWKPTTHP